MPPSPLRIIPVQTYVKVLPLSFIVGKRLFDLVGRINCVDDLLESYERCSTVLVKGFIDTFKFSEILSKPAVSIP